MTENPYLIEEKERKCSENEKHRRRDIMKMAEVAMKISENKWWKRLSEKWAEEWNEIGDERPKSGKCENMWAKTGVSLKMRKKRKKENEW